MADTVDITICWWQQKRSLATDQAEVVVLGSIHKLAATGPSPSSPCKPGTLVWFDGGLKAGGVLLKGTVGR